LAENTDNVEMPSEPRRRPSFGRKAHTTPPQRQLSHASPRFSRSVTVTLRKSAHPAYLTRWSFHGLFLISNLHDGCTGIPALLRLGTHSIHTTCNHSPRNLPHPRGELQQTARHRMTVPEPLVSSRKRYRLLSGPRCSALTLTTGQSHAAHTYPAVDMQAHFSTG
jgi:hypothetical protein